MKSTFFMYDESWDRLFISCKRDSDKIYGSVRVLNLTIDFTTDDKAVNFEIRNASKYLESLGLNPKMLDKLTGAEIVFQQKRDGYLIYFILQSGKQIERIPYNIISTESPLFPS